MADTAQSAAAESARIQASAPVRAALEALLAVLEQAGAWFSADLQWRETQQGLIAYSRAEHQDKRSYLRWPLEALPHVQPGMVVLDGVQLKIAPDVEAAAPAQATVLQAQLALLNATAAPTHWRALHPLLALASDSPLRQALAAVAGPEAPWQQYPSLLAPEEEPALCCASLLSRRLAPVAPAADQGDAQEMAWCLVPLLETFMADATGEPLSMNARAVPPSLRVFARGVDNEPMRVRFGSLDALDGWLRDATLDLSWPSLASVPLALRLPDGRALRVERRRAGAQAQLPPALQALRPYLPQVAVGDDEVRVSKLLIPPPAAPLALRRVLTLLLAQLMPDLSQADRQRWLAASEEQLLAENTAWWQARQGETAALPTTPVRASCEALCAWALAQLARYREQSPARQSQGAGHTELSP
ncbi:MULTISPECIES: hypothetical protein [Thiorhodovibrio]|uniref:hypothetical protein n=1 Tax=Thiorhodovibrio TaxID=61593 RepID=UPI0019135BE1|nr:MULTISPECIES: hypothetical protein [Thiorhodovibrio]MBK5969047.1 hypothetical protein [Thiorhodovibrio winogradskyi]WPL15071.1 hypothetical protein Thiosp_04935 [Thiorhodovibrio litoralis]